MGVEEAMRAESHGLTVCRSDDATSIRWSLSVARTWVATAATAKSSFARHARTVVPSIHANTLAVQPASTPPVSQRQRSLVGRDRGAAAARTAPTVARTRARNAADATK